MGAETVFYSAPGSLIPIAVKLFATLGTLICVITSAMAQLPLTSGVTNDSVQTVSGGFIPVSALATNGGTFNGSGITNITGFQLTGNPPYSRVISSGNGDSAKIVIAPTSGEQFWDVNGAEQLQITPSGVTFEGAGFGMLTNYTPSTWTPIAGQVIFRASNDWIYAITPLLTNAAFKIAP